MVFQDGYFYQARLFYSTKWTRPMEATFVDALVEHKKQGHFKPNGINFHAVMCAIYDVNRDHATKHSYATSENKLQRLKERYSIFLNILKIEGVLVNSVGRYVLADDATSKKMIKERVLCKCYVNAYEDFYESLCILFGPDTPDQPNLMYEEEEVDSVMAFYPPFGWVDEIPYAVGQSIMLPHINQLQNTSVDTASLWRFLEEYYPSDDEEEVNSILALPAAPPPSPDPSYVSVEHISSSASNEISKSN
ncbi:hypothetical protein Salat_1094600 [Sesamum alatum]|uniref:Myb/SANT-like domain-containing protein n=1 Tax=Sesamum alatum TaxID=300844 RepID=A0AAE2CSX8_9LAMI|nr:hypothetical protein Salat_1094600 [Sesamum alatum]